VDKLECQARFEAFAGLAAPAAEQIPSAQSQMFGHQQPQPHEIATDLIGEQLSHAALEARGVGRLDAGALFGPKGLYDEGLRGGAIAMEFFFAARIAR
jgi:hypothetical protein